MNKHNTIIVSHQHLLDVWLKEKEYQFVTIRESSGNYNYRIRFNRELSLSEVWHLCSEFAEWKAQKKSKLWH